MNVRLILEHAPHRQSVTERTFSGGQMTIGRGDDCDWQLDDPEKYVSRKHCVITEEDGAITLIDASSGGVFVDGGSTALGVGNSVPLEDQMRLRLGDFVIRIEMQDVKVERTPEPKLHSVFDFDREEETPHPPPERPENLPPKFGVKPEHTKRPDPFAENTSPKPIDRDGAFDLDLASKKAPWGDPTSDAVESTKSSGGGYFDTPEPAKPAKLTDVSAEELIQRKESTAPSPPIEVFAEPGNAGSPPVEQPSAKLSSEYQAGLAALYKGMGLDPTLANDASPEELEAIGGRFKELVDGVMFLLRTRAEEKVKVRVAQTIISNADVNPLKFMASSDEAILAIIRGRGDSYLSGDKAVIGAFRDLGDHQVRTWQALQTALRRMIDKFDPEEIEREIEDTGLLEKLIAGGRSAKMWQTYQEKYREIAQAAEERFLGEVGADFRDAYENERNRK